MPKVISLHSYRGGTGKSNFTANLAVTIARLGHRVGVVDTDLPSPGIHNIFGLEAKNTNRTLNQYLWGNCQIEEAAYDVSHAAELGKGELFLVPSSVKPDDITKILNDGYNADELGKGKVFLVPSSVKPDDIAKILKDGYDVKLLHDGFRKLVRNLQLDYLFIDTHPGLSKETFLSIAISHVLILILRPDKQDYLGTAVTVDVARQLKVRKMMIVVNKAYSKQNFDALKQKVEEAYDVPVAGIFPLSEDVVQLESEGVFCVKYQNHPISEEFRKVAQRIRE